MEVPSSILGNGSMNILLWIIMWIVGMGAYYVFFRPRGILYKNSPGVITGWYSACILVVTIILFTTNSGIFSALTPGLFLGVAPAGAVLFLLALSKRCENKKIQTNWFVTKSAEILFQQSMILWLTAIVFFVWLPYGYQILFFSIVFLLAHLPIYFFFSFKKASAYVIPSVLGGLVFMVPILFLQGGIYLSIGIHFLFYAFLANQGTLWGSEKHFSHF